MTPVTRNILGFLVEGDASLKAIDAVELAILQSSLKKPLSFHYFTFFTGHRPPKTVAVWL